MAQKSTSDLWMVCGLNIMAQRRSYLVASSRWINNGVRSAEVLWVIQVTKRRTGKNVFTMKALYLKLQHALQ